MLIEGSLDVMVDAETYSLTSGDAIRFLADKPHSYRNTSAQTVRFQSILSYA